MIVAVSVVTCLATPASSEETCDDLGSNGVGYGLLVPSRHCDTSLNFDLGYGVYRPIGEGGMFARMTFEPGALFNLGAEHRVQLGPVLAFSTGGIDYNWEDGAFDEHTLSPRARLRLWPHDYFSMDVAAGPLVAFVDGQGNPGAYLELSPRLHGFVGLQGAVEYLGDAEGTQTRWYVGANITLGGAAIGALTLLLVCLETGC